MFLVRYSMFHIDQGKQALWLGVNEESRRSRLRLLLVLSGIGVSDLLLLTSRIAVRRRAF